jgi:integrase
VVQRLMESGGEPTSRQGGWLFPSISRAGVAGHVTQPSMQTKVHYYQPYSKSRPDHVRTRLTVTHWSPHDLRRTGRTMLAAMRCPHDVGEAILGHVVGGVAGVYQQYRFDRERREWLVRLSDKLEAIIAA